MSFTINRLTGSRAVVRGTDILGSAGETVINTAQWDEINANQAFDQATEAFDAAVEEFFAPLTKAAEQAAASVQAPDDPAGYVVLREEVEGVRPEAGHVVKLTRDSIVLRLIEQGDTSRLVWVNGELEILERGAQVQDVVLPGTAEVEPSANGVPA